MRKYKSLYLPAIEEAVIVTSRYEKLLRKVFESIYKKLPLNKSYKETLKFLNIKFKNYYITFVEENEKGKNVKYGVTRGKSINNDVYEIKIFCTIYIEEVFKNRYLFSMFEDACLEILRHELVHRGQFISEKKQLLPDRDKLDKYEIKYYSNKYEIMAFANMIVEGLRFKGCSDDEILRRINKRDFSEEDEIIYFYQKYFRNYKDVINRLYKNIYEYVKGESKNIL